MSDIFISYSREDKKTAERLAGCFEACGWSVSWDREIDGSGNLAKALGEPLPGTCAVLVLWSSHSIADPWVQNEAREGAERNVLIPILVEADVQQPPQFRHLQAEDLSGWSGNASQAAYLNLERAISRLIGPTTFRPVIARSRALRPEPNKPHFTSRVLGLGLVVTTVVAAGTVVYFEPSNDGKIARAMGVRPLRQVMLLVPDSLQASGETYDSAGHHSARAAFDGKTETAWSSNGSTRGSKEWLRVGFSRPTYIERVVAETGCQSMPQDGSELFDYGARPKQLEVSTEPERWSRTVTVDQDARHFQIDIGRRVTWLRIDASDLWPPIDSRIVRFADVCISEIRLYGYPSQFVD